MPILAEETRGAQPGTFATDLSRNQAACGGINDRYFFSISSQNCDLLIDLDPFGNYLCQKLLEFSNDDQRTVLINNAAPQMVQIALNQHGTRALQKMIQFISTREQASAFFDAQMILLIGIDSNDYSCSTG